MEEKFSAVQTQQLQAQATAEAARMTGERALLEIEKAKLQQQAALIQAEQKMQRQVQSVELGVKKAESDIQNVAAVLPQHRQYMEVLEQKVTATKKKAKTAETVVARAASIAQVAVETVPEYSK